MSKRYHIECLQITHVTEMQWRKISDTFSNKWVAFEAMDKFRRNGRKLRLVVTES